jgi:hypothetical protein
MILKSEVLISELKTYTKRHIQFTKTLLNYSEQQLQYKQKKESWNILECLEHLNLYGNFYIPEIKKRISNSITRPSEFFKSGYLGNKFSLDMLPKENMKTMNTFKGKNPVNKKLNSEKVLQNFIEQQEQILNLLELAKGKNLTKIKTSITLPFLKFRLGDTFRFLIYHNERHIIQAENIIKILSSENKSSI